MKTLILAAVAVLFIVGSAGKKRKKSAEKDSTYMGTAVGTFAGKNKSTGKNAEKQAKPLTLEKRYRVAERLKPKGVIGGRDLYKLEDRENDWLARQLREEARAAGKHRL